MQLSGTEWVFIGFILYISGVQVQANTICALKGSAVYLTCSAEHPSSSMKWYTVNRSLVLVELTTDKNKVTYKMTEESNFTVTIKDLRESDEKFYCCRETTGDLEQCWRRRTELQVADLQVKVFPSSEGQTVTLMCSTSCPLTENPAAYIWYKNREFLYEDWSPWYQELVSSEEAVRYSCAVKGYEDLRAPEVSVDSVSPTCFSVTYAKGRMCSNKVKSLDEPCSITYPRDIHVQKIPAKKFINFKCSTSCPVSDPHTAFRWYWNRKMYSDCESQDLSVFSVTGQVSCAVKGNEDLHSDDICLDTEHCITVNYANKRICSLEGASVNISSEYIVSGLFPPSSKTWYKMKRRCEEKEDGAEETVEAAGRVDLLDLEKQHILTINDLRKNDTAEYTFEAYKYEVCEPSDLPGVLLAVTGLTVTMSPSAEVTEGQRVTLTCSTSCPLTDNTNYIWYLSSRPLSQNKHLVLDPVSIQHAGNYSCAVKTHENMTSAEKALTVRARDKVMFIMNAVKIAVLSLIPFAAFVFCLMMREKKTVTTEPRAKVLTGQEDQLYESFALKDMNPAAQREPAEQREDTV